ncbi:MAG: pyridoxamine 5'-phosphate oxidase family protein [Lachnospiraceae bacterium]|nr:pyridoxamine 5'-phosphate oxidase family protein [Lachnospiraceae bacterium]
MRRSDREIKDRAQIIQVMEKCDVCRLALHDEGYPYILPLNFGLKADDGQIVLYFHGASEGKKYELMEKDNRAAFEMDCSHELVLTEGRDGCSCTMKYESVVGRGRLWQVLEEEKCEALRALMGHYHKEEYPFSQTAMARTKVFKLVVEQVTGKVR